VDGFVMAAATADGRKLLERTNVASRVFVGVLYRDERLTRTAVSGAQDAIDARFSHRGSYVQYEPAST
jgi:hypothetical protein